MPFFDMHCHLDFASNAHEAAGELDAMGAGAFAVAVLPHVPACGSALPSSSAASLVRWGQGLHPWWIADGRAGWDEACALAGAIAAHSFVGEVGLDFGQAHGARESEQVQAFRLLAEACAQASGRVLSIHAVRAAHQVLDILEETGALANCSCIFHWFSDSADAFARAVSAGCFFSVGALMLRSKRGREYARQAPAARLLFETDEPAEGQAYDVAAMQAQLAETCAAVASSRGVSASQLAAQVAETSSGLLSLR